ncbi:hypothetical protein [Xanthomarina sp.]|uniref:hypothetical protein n=1 Tax=Xanthomarina sp. TaxID=1931211 RepID=UPI002BB7B27F|nr:hypothetical protein [Xanthomarina sp.]HLV38269.1 hypothetical protein [Xanthomarina sp.]
MDASVVYKVAKALPMEELAKLYDMLKADLSPVPIARPDVKNVRKFTDEDALNYLFNKLEIH